MARKKAPTRPTLDASEIPCQATPTLERFAGLVRENDRERVVPVYVELLSDQVTPVQALSRVAAESPAFLLESVAGGEDWGRYSFVGFDPELLLVGDAEGLRVRDRDGAESRLPGDPWERLRETLQRFEPVVMEGLPRFWGGAVGYVAYDAVRRFEPTVAASDALSSGLPEFTFAAGGMLLIFDRIRQTLAVVALVHVTADTDAGAAYQDALERLALAQQQLTAPAPLPPMQLSCKTETPDLPDSSFARADFEKAVERAQAYIREGDIFQVVLSQRFEVPLGDVDPLDVYRAMRVINPSPYMFYLSFPEVTVLGASPETLVRMEDGQATVRPIAGTRKRGRGAKEDQSIAEELLADPKERAEHVMLVDLGRNDLGRISTPGSVVLTEEMAIERYSHVMHIVSRVVGDVLSGRDAVDVLRATFPAGTLSGAPKVRAMQIIEELEPVSRGVYGGAVGYIGFDGNMDMAIAIRTAVVREGVLALQAGAGIVEASVPASEFEETVNKAKAGLQAIDLARHARVRNGTV